MTSIAVVAGSTRPGRQSRVIADWVLEHAAKRADAKFELVDLADHALPHLDEPKPAAYGEYANDHTRQWAAVIDRFDGFVFVTPEYNHSTTGVLKNALDYLYAEWNDKAAGFVGYGGAGGVRAVEQLRLVAAELQLATVRAQVALSYYTDFENFQVFAPQAPRVAELESTLDQVIRWSSALSTVRAA